MKFVERVKRLITVKAMHGIDKIYEIFGDDFNGLHKWYYTGLRSVGQALENSCLEKPMLFVYNGGQ